MISIELDDLFEMMRLQVFDRLVQGLLDLTDPGRVCVYLDQLLEFLEEAACRVLGSLDHLVDLFGLDDLEVGFEFFLLVGLCPAEETEWQAKGFEGKHQSAL